ncbi:hypothetical protein BDV26DRAFT_251765 [Aspergillus bertholletiae]|uniref:Uncharacterized protein n=1 Tax=Aspergillus bertholletiae TaxID=1226010 RepID=A0A5N7BNP0_9EURO|nr:hypothetical protein BDV26DRAFT_251765 [Aspergillus bertholletiae]
MKPHIHRKRITTLSAELTVCLANKNEIIVSLSWVSQKNGCTSIPFYIFPLFSYFTFCTTRPVDTCHLHIFFLVFLWFSFFCLLVYRGEQRDKILKNHGLSQLRSSAK